MRIQMRGRKIFPEGRTLYNTTAFDQLAVPLCLPRDVITAFRKAFSEHFHTSQSFELAKNSR